MTRPAIDSISPFFIVNCVHRSIFFYRDKLGFEVMFQQPPGPAQDPFFTIVSRDGAMIFLKGSGDPLPNPKRYSWARWDAYLTTGSRCSRRRALQPRHGFQRAAQ